MEYQHYKLVGVPYDDLGRWIYWLEGQGGDAWHGEEAGDGKTGGVDHCTAGEKRYCLAPKRIFALGMGGYKGSNRTIMAILAKLTHAMDVFLYGCILIKLFFN